MLSGSIKSSSGFTGVGSDTGLTDTSGVDVGSVVDTGVVGLEVSSDKSNWNLSKIANFFSRNSLTPSKIEGALDLLLLKTFFPIILLKPLSINTEAVLALVMDVYKSVKNILVL